jgi:hypothetical protein
MDVTSDAQGELESETHHTPDEVRDQLDSVSAADWVRLAASAHFLAQGAGLDSDDLLQVALERTLSGQRKWPVGVPLKKFISNVMKSIVSSARKGFRNDPLDGADDLDSGVDAEAPDSPEEMLRCGQVLEQVMQVFAGDQEALDILEGRGLGLDGEALRELVAQDKTAFDTACKRIRRRYLTHFLNENSHVH